MTQGDLYLIVCPVKVTRMYARILLNMPLLYTLSLSLYTPLSLNSD